MRALPLSEIVRLPRMQALYGEAGERCNACSAPARVEPSRVWGLHPGVLWQTIREMVLRRNVPRKRPALLPAHPS